MCEKKGRFSEIRMQEACKKYRHVKDLTNYLVLQTKFICTAHRKLWVIAVLQNRRYFLMRLGASTVRAGAAISLENHNLPDVTAFAARNLSDIFECSP